MFELLWNLSQEQRINELASDLRKAAEPERQITKTREELESLMLVTAAVWELLKERTGLTEDDLLRKIQEVDLRDGTADGRITTHAVECRNCRRMNSSRHPRCLYCGQAIPGRGAFGTAPKP